MRLINGNQKSWIDSSNSFLTNERYKIRSSVSSLSLNCSVTAFVDAAITAAAQSRNEATPFSHSSLGFPLAFITFAGNDISYHATHTDVFGMILAKCSSASWPVDCSITLRTESHMSLANWYRIIIATRVLTLQALNGLDFVRADCV